MKELKNQSNTYYETVTSYKQAGKAIAHFNISNLDQARTICDVAEELKQPVIIGVSEGERGYMGVAMVRAIVDQLNQEYSVPIFLNADHTYSFEKVQEVVELGYDSEYRCVDKTSTKSEQQVCSSKQHCTPNKNSFQTKIFVMKTQYNGD
jgi:fructose/tagatose bisphosphate aldolase